MGVFQLPGEFQKRRGEKSPCVGVGGKVHEGRITKVLYNQKLLFCEGGDGEVVLSRLTL